MNLRQAIENLRTAISLLSPFTSTGFDDRLVEGLDAFLAHDDFLLFLQGLIDGQSTDGVLSLTAPSEAFTLELERRKIDWARLVELLPQIIALVRLFSGK